MSRYTMRIAVYTYNDILHFRVIFQCLYIHAYLSHETTSWSRQNWKNCMRILDLCLLCSYMVYTGIRIVYWDMHNLKHVYTAICIVYRRTAGGQDSRWWLFCIFKFCQCRVCFWLGVGRGRRLGWSRSPSWHRDPWSELVAAVLPGPRGSRPPL